ncbi:MAG: phage minor head protein [Pseudomonadota bacterium]
MADVINLSSDPPPEVRRYFAEKGLRPAFSWLDVWGEEHAHAFTVAKAMELDVLTTIRDSLQDAIDDGTPYEAWARDLTPQLQRLGWWGQAPMVDPDTGETLPVQLGSPRRLRTIYQANIRSARAAGQWERAQRTKAGLPYFLYGLSTAEDRRPEHEAKVGTILPVDHPFWDMWFPPNGWGCECWARQITRREADRLGGVSDAPEIPTRPFENRRTGEVTEIPIGIDPGWHTNPGRARSRTVSRFLNGKLEEADPDLRRIAIADIAGGQMVQALARGDLTGRALLPIGVAPERIVEAAGLTGRIVTLSAATIAKQRSYSERRGFDAATYAAISQGMETGDVLRDDRGVLAALYEMDGIGYAALLKPVAETGELFLTSLTEHFTSLPRRRRKLERAGFSPI